jgi:N-acetylmuramoyl-L-alanine amidase
MNNKLVIKIIIFVIVLIILTLYASGERITDVFDFEEGVTVVLDPGHGGIDGGAESSSGVTEKDVNLNIALKLEELLEKQGVKVIMTRNEDAGLYTDDGSSTIRTLKTQDIHKRKEIIDDSEADLTVSIHLNSFSQDESVKGAQVFYPSEGDAGLISKSKMAAEVIQNEFNVSVNVDKKRDALQKNDVYILRNVSCPTVIAECGFLSNPDEANMLSTHAYQEEIAKVLKASICKFLESSWG